MLFLGRRVIATSFCVDGMPVRVIGSPASRVEELILVRVLVDERICMFAVAVGVGVIVGVAVGVEVKIGVSVAVAVGVKVAVRVGVAVLFGATVPFAPGV
jgi:hypothetical protein